MEQEGQQLRCRKAQGEHWGLFVAVIAMKKNYLSAQFQEFLEGRDYLGPFYSSGHSEQVLGWEFVIV